MRFHRLFLLLIPFLAMNVSATMYTVTNSGLTFTPASLTVNVGDTVRWDITSIHNAVEVSEATWNANGSTALTGGFSIPYGGGMHVFTNAGIHYYVCQSHIASGMKGTVTVTSTTSTNSPDAVTRELQLHGIAPQPATDLVVVDLQTSRKTSVSVDVFDVSGRKMTEGIERSLGPGAHTVPLRVAGLRSGVYFLRFVSDEQAFMVPLRITR